MPKRCHNCKSEEHLIGDCPTLAKDPAETKEEGKADTQKEEEKDKETEGEKGSTNEEKANKKTFRPRPKKNNLAPAKKSD